jgi:hypothetical protein
MPTPQETCLALRAEHAAIQALAAQFDAALAKATQTGNYTEPRRLKAQIEAAVAALEEKINPPEVRELGLEEQYAEQFEVFERAGILETLSNGEKGIKGIDGKEYPIPSFETLMARAREKQEVIKEKKPQGFTNLILVPFAMSLDALTKKYGERIKAVHAQGKLRSPDKTTLDLATNQPVIVWDKLKNADTSGDLVYDPSSFDNAHGGKTKAAILSNQASTGDTAPGWRILLMEDLPKLPREKQGTEIGGRKQLEANKTSNEYLAMLGTGQYANESGLSPEDWLALAITNLETEGNVTDDIDGGSGAYLVGAYLPKSSVVPNSCWDRDDRRAYLRVGGPGGQVEGWSARSSARI